MVSRKIGNAGGIAQQIGTLSEHVRQTSQLAFVRACPFSNGHARGTPSHCSAVCHKGLNGFFRYTREHICNASRLKVVGHGSRENLAVCPLRHNSRSAIDRRWIQTGCGCYLFKHIGNQGRIAINVCANLHHGCTAIAACECRELRFRHDSGNDHAMPS